MTIIVLIISFRTILIETVMLENYVFFQKGKLENKVLETFFRTLVDTNTAAFSLITDNKLHTTCHD